MKGPGIHCPTCGGFVGLNLSTFSGSPRIDTHMNSVGAECPSSRTFVSKRVYHDAKRGRA